MSESDLPQTDTINVQPVLMFQHHAVSDGIDNSGTTLHMSLDRTLAFQDGNNLLPLFAA